MAAHDQTAPLGLPGASQDHVADQPALPHPARLPWHLEPPRASPETRQGKGLLWGLFLGPCPGNERGQESPQTCGGTWSAPLVSRLMPSGPTKANLLIQGPP